MTISLLVPLVLLLLLGFFFHGRFALPAAFCPIASVSCVVLGLLLFGSLKLLVPGCFLLMAFVAAAGIWQGVKHPKAIPAYLLNPGILSFLAGALVLILAYTLHGHFYTGWDEYSHWGPVFKDMYMQGAMHQYTGLELLHHAYPQGTALLYFFFSRFAPGFSEAQTYAAMGVWLAACSVTLCAGQSWKRPLPAALALLVTPLFFILFRYSEPYITVYVDTLLGAVFGAAMVVALYPGRRRLSHCALAGLIAAAIAQVKDSGLFFMFIAGVIFTLCYCFELPADAPRRAPRERRTGLGLFWGTALLPALYWRVFLVLTHTPGNSFGDPLGQNLFTLLRGAATGSDPTSASIIERFWINLRVAPVVYNGYGTSLMMAALLSVGGLLFGLWLWKRRHRRGPALVLWALPVLFAAYLAGMLVMYLTMFTPAEGLMGASFERYMSSFFIGWCMAALAAALFYGEELVPKLRAAAPTVALVAVLALEANAVAGRDVLDLSHHKEDSRYGFESVSAQMLEHLAPDDRIWVIAQGTDLMYTYMFHYNLMPAKVDLWLPNQMGYGEADPPNAEQLAQRAREKGVSHILVYITDDVFDERYGAGFSDNLTSVHQNSLPSLYRVAPSGEPIPFALVVETVWPPA
ncbi:hypothetical protein LJC04_05200 [Ruminococcaceae bacterium OttesenSCG-928-O06]|nr:hypothetical protein [Ruminococcaceae bacterium OttesenSCG-928-O06]